MFNFVTATTEYFKYQQKRLTLYYKYNHFSEKNQSCTCCQVDHIKSFQLCKVKHSGFNDRRTFFGCFSCTKYFCQNYHFYVNKVTYPNIISHTIVCGQGISFTSLQQQPMPQKFTTLLCTPPHTTHTHVHKVCLNPHVRTQVINIYE